MKILIVEDELLYSVRLEMLIDKLGYHHLSTVDNSVDALAVIKKELPDLILMDVHIQGEYDGIELADMICKEYTIPVIFITSFQDDLTFKRASRVNPIQFLLKPFDNMQLQRSIEVSVQKLRQNPTGKSEEWENDFLFQEHFFIKTRQRLDKVAVKDVLYLEADGHYCTVYTNEKKFLIRMSMSELNKRLPEQLFFQIHRSHLVNVDKVDSVDLQDSVVIVGDKHLPLSRRNKEEFLKKLDWI